MVHAPTAKVQDFPGCLNTHKYTFQHNPLLPPSQNKKFLGEASCRLLQWYFPFLCLPPPTRAQSSRPDLIFPCPKTFLESTAIQKITGTVKPCFMDTRLIWTPHIIMDSLLCPLGKENRYIFSKFNPLNMDTLLIQALSVAPFSVCINGV